MKGTGFGWRGFDCDSVLRFTHTGYRAILTNARHFHVEGAGKSGELSGCARVLCPVYEKGSGGARLEFRRRYVDGTWFCES